MKKDAKSKKKKYIKMMRELSASKEKTVIESDMDVVDDVAVECSDMTAMFDAKMEKVGVDVVFGRGDVGERGGDGDAVLVPEVGTCDGVNGVVSEAIVVNDEVVVGEDVATVLPESGSDAVVEMTSDDHEKEVVEDSDVEGRSPTF